MQYCPNCGAQVDPNAQFCPECNASMNAGGHQGGQHQGGGQRMQGGGQPRQGGGHPRQGGGQAVQGGGPRGQVGSHQAHRGQSNFGSWDGKGYPRAPVREDTNVIGARIGAQIIDLIIAYVLYFVILLAFGGLGASTGGETGSGIAGLGFILAILGMLFYFFLLEGFWDGYTIGKKLLGIKVVKDNGESCSVGASVVRNILRFIDSFPAFYIIGFILMATNDHRKRLGDMAASTVVVTDTPN